MKKIKFSLFLILIFFFLYPKISFAQESVITPLVIASPTIAEVKKSLNYDLPYPGLLPDNPLYVLKMIRDKTVGFLISSPLKKAEFNLLQADKRLNAGVYLFNSAKQNDKKMGLSVSTISKGENYFYEAISEIKRANNQGLSTKSLTEKLLGASKKHQETISSLERKSKGNTRESFARENKRAKDFEKQVDKLLSKKSK